MNQHGTAQFFISYARKDKAFAVKLRRSLAARGRLAWLDLKNIRALALWRKEIAAAIDAADVFVFILSPDAVASAACRKELRLAVEDSAVRTLLELIDVRSGATLWRVRLGLMAEQIQFGALESLIVVRSRDDVLQVHDRANGSRLRRIRPESSVERVRRRPYHRRTIPDSAPAHGRRTRQLSAGSGNTAIGSAQKVRVREPRQRRKNVATAEGCGLTLAAR